MFEKIHTLCRHISRTMKHKKKKKNRQNIPQRGLFSPGIDASWEGIRERELYPITPQICREVGRPCTEHLVE